MPTLPLLQGRCGLSRVWTLVASLAFTSFAACGDGGPASGGGPEWLAAEAKPVKLTLELEADNRASRTITEAGGTLTATGEDGTRYRLRIPEGALLSGTVITMTPVRSVKGLPLGGGEGFATVQLEPEGLQLMKPAVLTIRSKRAIAPAEQVAFAWFDQGDDAHLYPLGDDTTKVELSLLHFSGYGFGRAPANDPGRLALQRAAASEARLASQVAAIIEGERKRDGAEGMSDEAVAALSSALVAYYDQAVAGLLREAETNDKMAVCATQQFTAWLRQAMLLGLVNDDRTSDDPELARRIAAGAKSAGIAYRNYIDKGKDRALRQCREQHDFSFPMQLMSLLRQADILGMTDGMPDMAGAMKDIQDVAQQCMRFEVVFESEFDNKMLGENSGIFYRLNARVPFTDTVTVAKGTPIGTAPITYSEFRAQGRPMGDAAAGTAVGLVDFRIAAAGTEPGTFSVLDLAYAMNPVKRPGVSCTGKDEAQAAEGATDFSIVIAPGLPKEVVRTTNLSPLVQAGMKRQWTDVQTGWAGDWARWHREEAVEVPGIVPVDGAHEPIGRAYRIALAASAPGEWRAEYRRKDQYTGHEFERSTVIVRHVPR